MSNATRNALNSLAFRARTHWQDEIEQSFTLRNQFTKRSVRVDKAQGFNVRTMQSVVGSVAPYMGDQETGAVVRGKSAHKGIPGPSAGGGVPGGKDRPKMVRRPLRLGSINIPKQVNASGGRARKNWVRMLQAKKKGDKFALLERPSGGSAIFRILGRKNKPKARLIWDFSKGSVIVKPEPTLRRALGRTGREAEDIMAAAVITQMRRHGVLGY